MNRVFADTSYWFSLAVRADANHARSLALTSQLQDAGAMLYLSELVVAETHRLVLYKLGIKSGQRFLDQLFLQIEKGFVRLLPNTWEAICEARELLLRFDDQAITLTDAASAALMRRQNIGTVASYDRHFEMMGFTRVP